MNCKHHPIRHADSLCGACGEGLCRDCSQSIVLGEYYCFNCALFVSKGGVTRGWGPGRYLLVLLSVLGFVLCWIFFLPL